MSVDSRSYYAQVQILRGLAALCVVIDHAMTLVWPDDTLVEGLAWTVGSFGVEIFFVISGFVMGVTTDKDQGGLRSALNFMKNRLYRILPIYWIATLIRAGLVFKFAVSPMMLKYTFFSLMFIPFYNELSGSVKPLLGVGWTLNYEMFFYAIFALSLLFFRQRTTILLLSLVLGALATFQLFSGGADPKSATGFYPHVILLSFVFGMALSKFRNSSAATFEYAGLASFTASAFAYSLLFLVVAKSFPLSEYVKLLNILIAGTCVAAAVLLDDRSRKQSIINRIFMYLGDISYSTYVAHLFALHVVVRLDTAFGGLNDMAFLALLIIGSHAAGVVTYHAVEAPIARIFKRKRLDGVSGFHVRATPDGPQQH